MKYIRSSSMKETETKKYSRRIKEIISENGFTDVLAKLQYLNRKATLDTVNSIRNEYFNNRSNSK
jgi:hypothetical protein